MKIFYTGKNQDCDTRYANIYALGKKECEKIIRLRDLFLDDGYDAFIEGDDDDDLILYVIVCDKEDYEHVKEIYINFKREEASLKKK